MRHLPVIFAFVLACGPSVEVDPPADTDPPVERCEQGMVGRACARTDGPGVCLSFDVCELRCKDVADCPPPWMPGLTTACVWMAEVGTKLCRYSLE